MKGILTAIRKKTDAYVYMLFGIFALLPMLLVENALAEYVSLLGTFALSAALLAYNRIWQNRIITIILLLTIVSLLVTGCRYGGWGAIVTVLDVLFCALVFSEMPMDHKSAAVLHTVVAGSLTAFVLTSHVDYTGNDAVTALGYLINQNMYGLFALAALMHWCSLIELIHEPRQRLLPFTAAFALLGYVIYGSRCRTAMMVAAVYGVLLLIKRKPFTYRWFRIFSLTLLFGSVAFLVLYMYATDYFPDLQVIGKSLFTGRQNVWPAAWAIFMDSPIFGQGTSLSIVTKYGTVYESGHHTILSLLYITGIVPTVSFVYLLTKSPIPDRERHAKYCRAAQFGFLAALLITFFESFFTDSRLFLVYLLLLPMRKEEPDSL